MRGLNSIAKGRIGILRADNTFGGVIRGSSTKFNLRYPLDIYVSQRYKYVTTVSYNLISLRLEDPTIIQYIIK